jgi:hypothetical protein
VRVLYLVDVALGGHKRRGKDRCCGRELCRDTDRVTASRAIISPCGHIL